MRPEKPRMSGEVDLSALRDLIEVLDWYRVYNFTEIKFLDKAVKEGRLGRGFMEEWREIRKTLKQMAGSAASIPGVIRLIKIREAIGFTSMLLITVAFVLLIAQIALKVSPFGLFGDIVFLCAFALLIVSFISRFLINRKIGLKIEAYYAEHHEDFKDHRLRLRKTIQDLLVRLSNYVKRIGEDENRYKIRLYNVDYKRITVIQEPDRWRKYYVVVPEPLDNS